MLLASSDVITAVVGGAGSFIGLLAGAAVTLQVERERRRREAGADLVRALASYLQACELVAVQIAELPAPSWTERQVDRIPTRRIGFAFQRLFTRLVFGKRLEHVTDLYQAARAEIVLLAPVDVLELTGRVDEVLREWERDRTPEWVPRWTALRDELRSTARSVVETN